MTDHSNTDSLAAQARRNAEGEPQGVMPVCRPGLKFSELPPAPLVPVSPSPDVSITRAEAKERVQYDDSY